LRFMNSKDEVDKTLANGPVRKDSRRSSNEIVSNIVDLVGEKSRATSFQVETPTYSLTLSKSHRGN